MASPTDPLQTVPDSPEPVKPVEKTEIPFWRLLIDQAGLTPEVTHYQYQGSGTRENPFLVQWIPDDPRDPMCFAPGGKWLIVACVSIATLAIAFGSSVYTGGMAEIMVEFKISREVATLGISLFVLGFAVGPVFWAPLSEVFGRQLIFTITMAFLTIFNAASAGAPSVAGLLIFRFLAGAFGASLLTNAGGVIADIFPPAQRGLAMCVFCAAPFLGPVLGPICGGFLGMNASWRWVMGLLTILSGVLWIFGTLAIPETYAPRLLRVRAGRLSKITGKHYVSALDHKQGRPTVSDLVQMSLLRPWVLLFKEPIVLLLSIYMAVVYGTLYMFFAAFPIVFMQHRGWNQGVASLPFIGIIIGMLSAVVYVILDNPRYVRTEKAHGGFAPPEARLPPTIVGSVALPIGLFWFAWTNSPSIHWIVPVIAGIPFGFGMVLVFLSIMNYLVDSYTMFAASVLAANTILRSLFGAAFPLITPRMYDNLGIHWASTVPALLSILCLPFPYLFYRYGYRIRLKCKFSALSAEHMRHLREQPDKSSPPSSEEDKPEGGYAPQAGYQQTVDLPHQHGAGNARQDGADPTYQYVVICQSCHQPLICPSCQQGVAVQPAQYDGVGQAYQHNTGSAYQQGESQPYGQPSQPVASQPCQAVVGHTYQAGNGQ